MVGRIFKTTSKCTTTTLIASNNNIITRTNDDNHEEGDSQTQEVVVVRLPVIPLIITSLRTILCCVQMNTNLKLWKMGMGKDHTLFAKVAGKVQMKKIQLKHILVVRQRERVSPRLTVEKELVPC
mmetsp:Transcript_46970/g.47776  ORF Transcript_46970/g.47776 Transcript_46970/m.47776 type:complete len:125 (+) Transcript_46970:316-690(+)